MLAVFIAFPLALVATQPASAAPQSRCPARLSVSQLDPQHSQQASQPSSQQSSQQPSQRPAEPTRQQTTDIPPKPTSSNPSTPTANPQDCSCGYVLTQHENAYFPLRIQQDFKKEASLPKGMNVAYYVTGALSEADGQTTCLSIHENVRFASGEMQLIVPGKFRSTDSEGHCSCADSLRLSGGQQAAGPKSITGAEVNLEDVTGGLFTMTAKMPSVKGTVASIFTFRSEEKTGGLVSDLARFQPIRSSASAAGRSRPGRARHRDRDTERYGDRRKWVTPWCTAHKSRLRVRLSLWLLCHRIA